MNLRIFESFIYFFLYFDWASISVETYVSIQRFQNIQTNVLHVADINYMLFQHLWKHCLYLLKFTTTVYHFKTFIIVSPSCTWSPMHKYFVWTKLTLPNNLRHIFYVRKIMKCIWSIGVYMNSKHPTLHP